MENVSFPAIVQVQPVPRAIEDIARPTPADWRAGLPVLSDGRVTLRELRASDAGALFTMLTGDEVTRFISAPPPDVRGFERFIQWAHAERSGGRYACFAVVPAGYDVPVGIVQVRQLDPAFSTAEWGACLGSQFWGTGLFTASARLLLDFIFTVIGARRLEARAAVQNGRGNGGMRKLGAVQEGVLRQALYSQGRYHDQILWSILADDWRQSRMEFRPRVH